MKKFFMAKTVCMVVLACSFLCGVACAGQDGLFTRLSNTYENARVERVIKSDLILLDNGKKIRLIGVKGINQPRPKEVERDKNGFIVEEDTSDPTTSLEDQASDFTERLLTGKKVKVEFDTQTTDDNGYTWGYVFFPDGTMANAEILRQGFAQLQIHPPNIKYADRLRDAYREARQEKRGIHAE
jgi:micrococcal nuclease